MKNIGIFIIFGLVAFGIVSCQKNSEVNRKETVKIGVILPLSGNMAFLGEDFRDGMLLASKEFPQNKFHYEIIFENTQFDASKAALAAQKLINVNKTDCVVSVFSETFAVTAPIVAQNQKIHFAVSGNFETSKQGYAFNHYPPISDEAKVLSNKLSSMPYKKLGIVAARTESSLAVLNAFKKEIAQTTLKITFEEIFVPGTMDFRTLIAKARQSDAEIFLFSANQPDLEIFVKEWREFKNSKPLISLHDFIMAQNLKFYEGYFYACRADALADFSNKFESAYHRKPNVLAPHGYDILGLLISAYEKYDQKPSAEQINATLFKTENFTGALGKLKINPDGSISSPIALKQIQNGKHIIMK